MRPALTILAVPSVALVVSALVVLVAFGGKRGESPPRLAFLLLTAACLLYAFAIFAGAAALFGARLW